MFETEIRIETDHLLQQLQLQTQRLYVEELLAIDTIHPAYRQFFAAEVQWWIYQQQLQRRNSPYFDFAAEPFIPLLRQYDELCRQYAWLDPHTRREIGELAVKTRFNFLIRPQTTLRWFVFRGDPTQTAEIILLRLRYFAEYPYLIEGLAKSVDAAVTTPQQLISAPEFERMIINVEQDELLDYTPAQFLALLEPMEQLFQEVYHRLKTTVPAGIPTAALIVFLYDKGIHPLAAKLQEMLQKQEKKFLTREQLQAAIQELLEQIDTAESEETIPLDFAVTPSVEGQSGSSGVVPASEEVIGHTELSELNTGFSTETEAPLLSEEEKSATVPEEDSVERILSYELHSDELEETSDEHIAAAATEEPSQGVIETEDRGEELPVSEEGQTITTVSESSGGHLAEELTTDEGEGLVGSVPNSPQSTIPEVSEAVVQDVEFLPFRISPEAERVKQVYLDLLSGITLPTPVETEMEPLRTFLSLEEQERIVGELFHGDEYQWMTVLEKLEESRNWKDAAAALDQIVLEQKLDPSHPLIQRLRDALYRRFVSVG